MSLALKCCTILAAMGPLLMSRAAGGSVVQARHRRQLQNSYLGLGANVEILPVGDTSGVSSSYSLVETSKVPKREPYHVASATAQRNSAAFAAAARQRDLAPDYLEHRSNYHNKHQHPGRVRFPEERRGRVGEDEDDFDSDKPKRKKTKAPKKPVTAAKGDEDGADTETFGESKPSPKNIKEIVEERPSESKLSGDLSKDSSRLIGHGGGFGGGSEYDKEKHYDKEQGQKFLEGHKSEEGEKAEKAFKKQEEFDKGQKEDYGSDEKHSQVAEKAGEKKGHVDQGEHFGEAYQGNKGEKGISVVKKGGHKKGKKTSGFHKVHHKDEYKKDEVFYDEAHDGKEHEEHAHEHEKHAKEKGGSEKKAHSDTGYHETHGAKKAESDHGKKYEAAKGHKSEAGEHAHHGHNSEYAKKGGVKEGEKYGHAEGGGGGYFEKDGYFD